MFDLSAGSEVWRVNTPSNYVNKTIFIDPELEYFVILDPVGGYVCSFETGEQIYDLWEYYRDMEPVGITEDGRKLAVYLWEEKTVVLFDIEARQETLRFKSENEITSADISKDGKSLFVFDVADNLSVVDCQTGSTWYTTVPGVTTEHLCLPDGDLVMLSESDAAFQVWRLDTEQKSLIQLPDGGGITERPIQLCAGEQYLYCVYEDRVQIFSLYGGTLLGEVPVDTRNLEYGGGNAYTNEQGQLILIRQGGVYIVQEDWQWKCACVYDTTSNMSRAYCSGDQIALIFDETSSIQFLSACGDENGVPTEKQAEPDKWSMSFEYGALTLKAPGSSDSQTVECPYDLIGDALYFRRGFWERVELRDYAGGLVRIEEFYSGDYNGTAIVCYYEGGYQEESPDYDTPDAYAIYSAKYGQWNWFEDEILSDASIGIFFMRNEAGFAIAGGSNTLKLYDAVSNSVIWELQVPLTYLSGVRFSNDDRYLLAFDSAGYQSVLIDRKSGAILASFAFCPAVYQELDFVVTEDRVFLEKISPDGIHDYGVIIERETWEVVANISQMEYYDPETDRVICKTEDGEWVAYPAYSTQDLIAMGKEILAANR